MSDTNLSAAARAPRYEDLSQAMELSLLAPELTEEEISSGCNLARRCQLAAVVVRPADLDLAERWVGAPLVLGAAIDWPHGYSTTAVKQYAARDALRRGAREITVAMNTGKLVSRQFQYLEMEMLQIAEACHEVQAVLTIHLESRFLTDEHKIVACRVAKRVSADWLSTGEAADLPLLREHARDRVKLKLRGVDNLDAALAAYAEGCTRLESTNAAAILEEWKQRLAAADA